MPAAPFTKFVRSYAQRRVIRWKMPAPRAGDIEEWDGEKVRLTIVAIGKPTVRDLEMWPDVDPFYDRIALVECVVLEPDSHKTDTAPHS